MKDVRIDQSFILGMIQIHLKFYEYESALQLYTVSVYLMGRFQNIEKYIQNLKKFISLYLHFSLRYSILYIHLSYLLHFNLFIIAILNFSTVFCFVHKTHINRSSIFD